MPANDLVSIAQQMVASGKGILAADESTGTIAKRFETIKVENVEENRRVYRDMLFTTKGLGDYISGVILYDETIRQKASDGTPFVELLAKNGILPGIKVDNGAKPLPFCPEELVTEGLDGLPKRCAEYVKMGAKFAKWRAVITIGKDIPSATCIEENAHALARYAAICQEAGLVPIVEPEVLMDGDHTIDRCCGAHGEGFEAHGAVCRRRRRVPVWRPKRRGRHRASEFDEPPVRGQAALAAFLLVRARAAGAFTQGLER
jgi:fructose-bisphosphate aldolase class I